MTGGATVVAGDATRFLIPVAAGDVDVRLRDGLEAGHWRFRTNARTSLCIDFLSPSLCSIADAERLEGEIAPDFIPTPRLRFEVNDHIYDVVSRDPGVLARHYARPHHQEVAYHRPDPWTNGFHGARLHQVRRLLRGVRGDVCDVGSGHSLLSMAGPWEFHLSACDVDAEAIKQLQESGIDARIGSAQDPPFPPGTFDAVFAGEIIEHLMQPQMALQRWARLLRPGGLLVVTTPNRRHWLARARGFEMVENMEHLFEWDVPQLLHAVRRSGMRVEAVEGLLLPIPAYKPGRGWRDLGLWAAQRLDVSPQLVTRYMSLGRLAPRLAFDVAVAARKPA